MLGKFIDTEPPNDTGGTWETIKTAFTHQDCVGYWRFPIFSKTGELRKEPDIMLVDRRMGIIIIEVMCITIDQILAVDSHQWELQNFYLPQDNPCKRAENFLYAISRGDNKARKLAESGS